MTTSESSHGGRLRVVVTGAAGSVGASVIEALAARDEVREIVGLARRPGSRTNKTSWIRADVVGSELEPIFAGADAVIHLAWATRPSHDLKALERLNVDGSRRVFEAAAAAGVEKLIYASSAGAYSPGPKGHPVSEDWPVGGTETSFYSRHKAMVEAELDEFELRAPQTKVVRLRPALVFKGEAAAEMRRLFGGPFLPSFLLRRRLIPSVPRVSGLCVQAVHSADVGRAFALAAVLDVRGPFNLAADPPLGSAELGAILNASTFPVPFSVARRIADLSWRLRLQPTSPGWLDMARNAPLISSERATRELDWEPEVTAIGAVIELLEGAALDHGKAAPTTKPRGKLVEQLDAVHAIEEQALAQMRRAPKLASDDRVAAIFEAHLKGTEGQERRVRERLEAHGVDPSKPQSGSGGIGITAFAASQPDTPEKLVSHAFSYAHLEVAAYELLRRTADVAGDAVTAAMAKEIAAEEERMAERLVPCFDAVLETSLNGDGPAGLSPQLDRHLAAAHAIEKQGLQLLEMALKIVDDAELKGLFEKHLRESEEHELMLRERLEARGLGPAKAKDATLRIGGQQLGAFFAAQPETAARLSGFAFAFEHLEIAAYELLARVARRAGDEKVLGVAERVISEERAAAEELAGRWDRVASPASS
jgi:UDP-glucose 4-epimerase